MKRRFLLYKLLCRLLFFFYFTPCLAYIPCQYVWMYLSIDAGAVVVHCAGYTAIDLFNPSLIAGHLKCF